MHRILRMNCFYSDRKKQALKNIFGHVEETLIVISNIYHDSVVEFVKEFDESVRECRDERFIKGRVDLIEIEDLKDNLIFAILKYSDFSRNGGWLIRAHQGKEFHYYERIYLSQDDVIKTKILRESNKEKRYKPQ